jgi:YVTN family beta-propeller protein
MRLLAVCTTLIVILEPSLGGAINKLYTVSEGASNIVVINGNTGALIATISDSSINVSFLNSLNIVKKPDDTRIYFTNPTNDTLQIVDTAADTVSSVMVQNTTGSLAITPNGAKVYVSNVFSNSISVLNTSTETVATTIGSVSFPRTLAASLTRVYVNTGFGADMGSIDVTTDSVLGSLAVPSATSIAFTPSGDRAYVASNSGNVVYPITTATDTVGSTIAVGSTPTFLAVNPTGSKVYVANLASNNISVINVATNTVTNTISVGSNPIHLVFSPDGSKAFVLNTSGGASISVIDTASETVTTTISVGGASSTSLAISSDGTLLATQSGTTSVAIIDAVNNQVLYPAISTGGSTLRLFIFATVTAIDPPSGFTGIRKVNNFIVAEEYYNSLTWTLSADEEVSSYILKRNGVTIATLGATTNSYEDHNRNPSASDTYTLIAVDASGNESDPLTVTVGG